MIILFSKIILKIDPDIIAGKLILLFNNIIFF